MIYGWNNVGVRGCGVRCCGSEAMCGEVSWESGDVGVYGCWAWGYVMCGMRWCDVGGDVSRGMNWSEERGDAVGEVMTVVRWCGRGGNNSGEVKRWEWMARFEDCFKETSSTEGDGGGVQTLLIMSNGNWEVRWRGLRPPTGPLPAHRLISTLLFSSLLNEWGRDLWSMNRWVGKQGWTICADRTYIYLLIYDLYLRTGYSGAMPTCHLYYRGMAATQR